MKDKIKENTFTWDKGCEMIILDGSRIEEFIESCRTGASKRAVEKFKRLEAMRNIHEK